MTSKNIIVHRLRNQRLSRPAFTTPAQAVRWMGAVQAQDYASAHWALGLRMQGGTAAAIDEALADGTILRTHVMRPTWHFVAPEDIRWMLELTAAQVNTAMSYNFRRLGLDAAVFKRSNSILARALEGGRQLTRLELTARLKQQGIETDNLGFLHILMRAEIDRIICSGGRRGKQFTYALLDERAPQARTMEREEALRELAARYVASHGPATARDFAWWSGLKAADAKAGLELARPRITDEVLDGQTYWSDTATPAVRATPHEAYLLPNFDEYMVGYTDRSALIDPEHSKKLDGFATALLGNALVIDGRITGTWKRTFKKDTVVIELKLLASLNRVERRELDEAIKRYGRFMGMKVKVLQG